MSHTRLIKLTIEKFRALNNVEIEFGDFVTVICGKNGTSKSSILGIAAQIFSFEKDYVKNQSLSFKQITDGSFKSQYSEHFRISNTFDLPGSMSVEIRLRDGYTGEDATAKLELMKRGESPRPVVRNNSTASKNTSRNFTHPVIFLSLKRLYPIAAREYKIASFDYLQQYTKEFIGLTNELLNRSSNLATGTGGTISSAVAHGQDYDQDSVSAGEDNAGQIVLALMSFRKLKQEYPDYKGGLLLIDEADAGLFPTAQVNLLRMLERECKDLNLQVIMTSHSPVLIESAFELSQKYRRKYKTIYLSDTYGNVQVMQDFSWSSINADIHTITVDTTTEISLPRINVYFEDSEAADFFAALMHRQPVKKYTAAMSEISLGCGNYLQLIQKKVSEFSEKSIICLDGDQNLSIKNKNLKTVVSLPGQLPPDQLMFEYLYNLPANHPFWKNEMQFTRSVFTNLARDLINEFGIHGDTVNLKDQLALYRGDKKPRELFKTFYKYNQFQKLLSSKYNPWKYWIAQHPELTNEFLNVFINVIYNVMKNGYNVSPTKLTALKITLRKT